MGEKEEPKPIELGNLNGPDSRLARAVQLEEQHILGKIDLTRNPQLLRGVRYFAALSRYVDIFGDMGQKLDEGDLEQYMKI